MSEGHKKALERSLWAIADSLRGKMSADAYRKLDDWSLAEKLAGEVMGERKINEAKI